MMYLFKYTQETATTRLVWGSLRLAPIIDLQLKLNRWAAN